MSHLRSKTCHAIACIRRGRATVATRVRPWWSTRGMRQPGTWPPSLAARRSWAGHAGLRHSAAGGGEACNIRAERRAEAAERRRRMCEWEEVEKEQGQPRVSRARRRAAEFTRPIPSAAEQGPRPRGGAELLEDRAPPPSSSLAAAPARLRPWRRPLPPPSQRPRLGSGRRGGAPARVPASHGGLRWGRGCSAPSTSLAPRPYGAKDPPASN